MLGRFIAPASGLAEIAARPELAVPGSDAWEFSVLVGDRQGAAAALAALPGQGALVKGFETALSGRARVVSLEAPLPSVVSSAEVAGLLARMVEVGLGGREVFFEIPAGADDHQTVAAVAEQRASGFALIGAKLRCGGVTPDAFPKSERVARVIARCAELGLPLKCTAGLHHPMRHRDPNLGVMMHGFLNVFGAGLLARSGVSDLGLLTECVTETEAAACGFDDGGFHWRNLGVATAEIREIRRRTLRGFGSCSFAEPRADLRELGLL